MSTCPRCFEDTGCTCKEQDRIEELEKQLAEAQGLYRAEEMVSQLLGNTCDRHAAEIGYLTRKLTKAQAENEALKTETTRDGEIVDSLLVQLAEAREREKRLEGLVWRVWNHDGLTSDEVQESIEAMKGGAG